MKMDALFRFEHAQLPDGHDGEKQITLGGGCVDQLKFSGTFKRSLSPA